MKCSYAVTFESENGPPETVRGTVEAGGAQTMARLAVVEAKRKLPGKYWHSMVVLLEKTSAERVPEPLPEAEAPE